jgi:hypothetical protein
MPLCLTRVLVEFAVSINYEKVQSAMKFSRSQY